MEKELQLAKDFVLFSILLNERKEFIMPNYYKSNFSIEILDKAIEELKNNEMIIIQKLSDDKTIITLKHDKIEDFTISDNSFKEKLDNYKKLKAIKVKNTSVRPVCKLNTNS